MQEDQDQDQVRALILEIKFLKNMIHFQVKHLDEIKEAVESTRHNYQT